MIALVATWVVACWVQAPSVGADPFQQQYGFTAAVSPSVAGTTTAPAPVTLRLQMTTVPDNSRPAFSTSLLRFDVDRSAVISLPASGSCSAAQIMVDPTGCTRVGDGTMSFTALGLTENLSVAAYGQADPQELLLLVDGTAPVVEHAVMEFHPIDPVTGGIDWTLDSVPLQLQQPAPGAYATWTNLDVTLRSITSLVGCPNGSLRFVSYSQFTDGSEGDSGLDVPCSSAPADPPVSPPPTTTTTTPPPEQQATPVVRFTTQVRKRHGHVLGKLLALQSIQGVVAGSVRVTCVASCKRRRLGSATIGAGGSLPPIRLRPPLPLTKATRIKLVFVDARGVAQTQRFKFVRRGHALVAIQL